MKKVGSLLPGPVGLSSMVWSHCHKWELSAWHLTDIWNATGGEPNLWYRQAMQCRSFMLKMNSYQSEFLPRQAWHVCRWKWLWAISHTCCWKASARDLWLCQCLLFLTSWRLLLLQLMPSRTILHACLCNRSNSNNILVVCFSSKRGGLVMYFLN